jgi:hypothetical protein
MSALDEPQRPPAANRGLMTAHLAALAAAYPDGPPSDVAIEPMTDGDVPSPLSCVRSGSSSVRDQQGGHQ